MAGFVMNVRDVSERVRAEEELAKQLAELRRWQEVMLNRVDRDSKFKREINEICRRHGETVRYPSQEAGGSGES
jgi:hypothetical protein